MANKENIRVWVDALRSDEYVQVPSVLHAHEGDRSNGRCCLGVACDVSKLGFWKKVNEGDEFTETSFTFMPHQSRLKSSPTMLPPVVRRWLGVNSEDPELDFGEGERMTATEANDDEDKTFDEIAEAIERTYLK